ncbi:MAG: thymidine kinase [Bacteroidota bacterium]
MAKLYYNYSAMNAGKSTTLLQVAHNYKERGMRTLLFLPLVDKSSSRLPIIASRIGISSKAISCDSAFDFFSYVKADIQKHQKPLGCVLVDEAQFLSKAQVTQLTAIVDEENIPVLTYGLRTDFKGALFEGASWLLAWADEIREVKTICHCGRKAIMNIRVDAKGKKIEDGPQIQLGGNESYIASCRQHYKQGNVLPFVK